MDERVLDDPKLFPGDEVVFSHLGRRRVLWEAFFAGLREEHPDFEKRWRYYNDGKSWLMNVSRKKKTIFWLAVVPGAFRITAYFTDKATAAILASALSDGLKKQFTGGRSYGRLRGITVTFTSKGDVKDARVLVALKVSQA